MNYVEADTAIITNFAAFWAARCPAAYPDIEFDRPKQGEYITMTIKNYDGFQSSIGTPGANRFDRRGLITFQCLCPQNTGGKLAKQRANEIINFYMPPNSSGVKYFDQSQKEIGNDGTGFYQINVTIFFRFEDFA